MHPELKKRKATNGTGDGRRSRKWGDKNKGDKKPSQTNNNKDSDENSTEHMGFVAHQETHHMAYMAYLPVRTRDITPHDARNKNLRNQWILDTGANIHLTYDRTIFTEFTEITGHSPIKGVGGSTLHVQGKGTVRIEVSIHGQYKTITLSDVLYTPGGEFNLLSLTMLLKKKARIIMEGECCEIQYGGKDLFGSLYDGLFLLDLWNDKRPAFNAFPAFTIDDPAVGLWHERMGHLGVDNVLKLTDMAIGMDFKDPGRQCVCEACVMGKLKANPHKSPRRIPERAMQHIHSDVAGPMYPGTKGERYWVTCMCGKTKKVRCFAVKHKHEAFGCVKRFALEERVADSPWEIFISDGGGEYISNENAAWMAENGIKWEPSTPGNPQQNANAEALNKTLYIKVFPTLISSGLHESLWPEVLQAMVYIYMRSPHASLGMTPFEAATGRKPVISHIRTIGSKAWSLVRNHLKVPKFKSKVTKCILVGFEGDHIYRLLQPNGYIVRSSTVVFDERRSAVSIPNHPPKRFHPQDNDSTAPSRPRTTHAGETDQYHETVQGSRIVQMSDDEVDDCARITRTPDDSRTSDGSRRSSATLDEIVLESLPRPSAPTISRTRAADPVHFTRSQAVGATQAVGDNSPNLWATLAVASSPEPYEPKTYKEAISDSSKNQWDTAMKEELQSLAENSTWTLDIPPPNRKILRGRWVFKLKRGPAGEITRYKARWVVRGFEQREGIDYHETFASVVKPMSYKALFAIVAAKDWELEQMDVKTAFLYGDIDEEIYVEQPTGAEDGTTRVCKLRKALYGLKQSPRLWNNTCLDFFKKLGYSPLTADMSVLTNGQTYVAIYVDDLLLAGPSATEIADLKVKLNKRFQMSDLGPCSYYLGMKVTRDRPNRVLRLSQTGYIEEVLRKFDMDKCNPSKLPMDPHSKLFPTEEGETCPADRRTKYQSAVGSLMYAMLGTRPDIAYAVSVVSRYASNPNNSHFGAVNKIFRYLRGTAPLGLTFRGDLKQLKGYTDADWGGDTGTRRSTSGYVYNIGSGAISWSSKRQPTVALSTCEAEYIGQTQAAKEAIWLKELLGQLNVNESEGPHVTVLYCDNLGAMALAKNPQFHARTKHIDIQHHFVREKVAEGQIALQHVSTDQQVADGLTKPLPKDKFVLFRDTIGLEDIGP